MSILKRAEPKSRASVIRPAKQMLVEGVEQTGRQGRSHGWSGGARQQQGVGVRPVRLHDLQAAQPIYSREKRSCWTLALGGQTPASVPVGRRAQGLPECRISGPSFHTGKE